MGRIFWLGLMICGVVGCTQVAEDIGGDADDGGVVPTVVFDVDTAEPVIVVETATAESVVEAVVPTVTGVPEIVLEEAMAPVSVIPADVSVLYEEEIVFAQGATSGAVSHELKLDEAHRFVLYASEGQQVEVRLTAETDYVSDFSVILAPLDGGPLGIGLGQSAEVESKVVLSAILPETGPYGLVLMPPEDWTEPVIYHLSISISALGTAVGAEEAVSIGYRLADAWDFGSYHVALFNDPQSFLGDGRAMVFHRGRLVKQIGFAVQINELSGVDLTQTGYLNLIVETYTGGAHCCSGTFVYELEEMLTPVLEIPYSECGGSFADLEGDGRYEFLTCDDTFAYRYCSYASSPLVQVVLGFDGTRYVPMSPDYQYLYADAIATGTVRAQGSGDIEMGWDGTNKCVVLPAVLSNLYSGQGEAARRIFNETYTEADREVFWAELIQVVNASPLYVAPDDLPLIVLPDSYRLEHGYDCATEEGAIWIMGVDEPVCGSPVAVRDIFWLAGSLSEAGILPLGHYLRYEDDCTADCEILVATYDDSGGSAGVGMIELKATEDGFGYLIYGGEQWRLRGDMGWEKVE